MQKQHIILVLLGISTLILIISGGVYYYQSDRDNINTTNVSNEKDIISIPEELSPQNTPAAKTTPPNKVNTLEEKSTLTDTSKCNEVDSTYPAHIQQRQKDICVRKIALEENDLNLCDQIVDEDISSGCYEHFAVKEKDTSICEKIRSTTLGYDSCRFLVAKATQDLTLCDTLPDDGGTSGRDYCYAAIGGIKNDYAICEMIPDDSNNDYRYSCIEQVARGKGECEVITKQSGKDYCYLYQSDSIQVTARDNRCDVYKEPKLADLCVKHLSGEITLETMCGKISDEKLKQQCLTNNINGTHVNYHTEKSP